jgi:glutathione reductase (NADPH)
MVGHPMDDAYDLIVIGAGNAGQEAAGIARSAGWRVAIVEARDVGGTCPLRGCIPKKVLAAASEVADLVRRAPRLSINVGPPPPGKAALDWTALIARERTFVDGTSAAMKEDLVRQGIDVIEGRARFVDPHAISVSGRSEPLRARKILVATGSVPRPLPFPGGDRLLTSDDILELGTLPPTIAFVGAGVIAFELGHVMARAGARVTMLETAPRVLPGHDAGAVDRLLEASAARGIDVQVAADVRSIDDAPDGTRRIQYRAPNDSGPPRELRVHAVAHGAGRVADLAGLDLAAAGVATDGGRPRLDDAHCSRSNPDIWFAGDAVPGKPQLSALATYEGRLVARNLIRDQSKAPDYTSIPSVVFTTPALASVGPTEEDARARGLTFEARVNDMRTWRSARSYAEEIAWAKVLIDRGADRVIGAHIVGHGATELINTFALAMRYGIPVTSLVEGVYAYPTFHSELKFLL